MMSGATGSLTVNKSSNYHILLPDSAFIKRKRVFPPLFVTVFML